MIKIPIYLYKCSVCGNESEVMCSFNDRKDFIECPVHWRKTPSEDKLTMKLVPTFASFVVNGFNEANGYSKEG